MAGIPENKLQKSLIDVPFERGFHFCTHGGRYTGISAMSLADLEEKIKTIDEKAISFHLARNDFQKWVMNVFFDGELAGKINKLNIDATDTREKRVEIIRSHRNFLSSI
jgi:hypothetical protein